MTPRQTQKGTPPRRRTREQIRAGNRRIGLVLLVVVAGFFAAAIVHQVYFTAH
ncbi:cytochrome oxidase small assembly protein [Paraburkholderia sp. J41]|uniref:cytochrome oxidase small assembly protein n=1 Tax=Paraburkholderia sp. J41 TaxID=2805433 RepID=UPI0039F58A5C